MDQATLFKQAEERFGNLLELDRVIYAHSNRALFKAYDKVLKRPVALRTQWSDNEQHREWFRRENEILASLEHPSIRTVYSAGEAGGWLYRTAKWIEGENLAEAVGRGPRPIPVVLRIAQSLSEALEYAHSVGVILRRVAPTTVMLPIAGFATITDLRFANPLLAFAGHDEYPHRDSFLAPETRDGSPGEIASDIYNLGALLYYAVTGIIPDPDPSRIVKPRKLRPACPHIIERIVLRAMSENPADRYLTATEMVHELTSDLGDQQLSQTVVPPRPLVQSDSVAWEKRLRRALGDDYELLQELGSGGFGTVYKVLDLKLEREVALKVLHPHWSTDPRVVERFHREARLAAKLNHPNIVNIYDIDGRGGLLWYTMAYVSGASLATLVGRDGPLGESEVIRLLDESLSALEHAHGHGVIHRDLKPENMLMEDDTGSVRIADFGLAVAVHGPDRFGGASSHSGTPEFAAPEQLLGEPVDERADLYSLSLVAHYALTGRSPYRGGTPESVLARKTTQPLDSLDSAAGAVSPIFQVLEKGARLSPEDRFASARAYRDALRQTVVSS